MNTNVQYRDEQGNVVRLHQHQPSTASEVVSDIAMSGLIVAIVVIACIVLL